MLQEELAKIYKWADTNNAVFNSDKFEAIRFATNHADVRTEHAYQAYSGKQILFNKDIRDLGIWMSEDMTFTEHIRVITAKARKVMGMALRTFSSRSTEVMLPLLKSVLRPQVEYGCQIWSPTSTGQINQLESIQRKFTSKFARFRVFDETLGFTICNTTYEERLRQLKITSLQRRRERYMILYMHKIKLHLVPNPGFDYVYRRCQKFSFKPKEYKKPGRTSFFNMGPRLFNSIPPDLRELDDVVQPTSLDLDKFKKKLDKVLSVIIDDVSAPQENSLLQRKYISN